MDVNRVYIEYSNDSTDVKGYHLPMLRKGVYLSLGRTGPRVEGFLAPPEGLLERILVKNTFRFQSTP